MGSTRISKERGNEEENVRTIQMGAESKESSTPVSLLLVALMMTVA